MCVSVLVLDREGANGSHHGAGFLLTGLIAADFLLCLTDFFFCTYHNCFDLFYAVFTFSPADETEIS